MSRAAADRQTPMMRQYLELKRQHPECILLFRCGDFYEVFFEDARLAARELEITLTTRDRDAPVPVPMCGVPHHAVDQHIARLIRRGHKVAVCDQLEPAGGGTGLFRREVTRVVTPGMLLDDQTLQSDRGNYLAAVFPRHGAYGMASVDISTGEFLLTEAPDREGLAAELARLQPNEAVVGDDEAGETLAGLLAGLRPGLLVNRRPAAGFSATRARERLLRALKVGSLDGYGCDDWEAALAAAAGAFAYIDETRHDASAPAIRLRPYQLADHLVLDERARRHLELEESPGRRGRQGTLLHVLDRTVTPMGGRRLREWLGRPLRSPAAIEARLQAVADMLERLPERQALREALSDTADIERIAGRVAAGRSGPRDLAGLGRSLGLLPSIGDLLSVFDTPLLSGLAGSLGGFCDLAGLLARGLVDSPPPNAAEGGVIRDGYDPELDRLRDISSRTRELLLELERKERDASGIPSLKIGYNKVFGYFLEVTRTHLPKVPPAWIRRQTLANGERFVTDELKRLEDEILAAGERGRALEQSLLAGLVAATAAEVPRLLEAAAALAEADVLAGFAEGAERNGWSRPELSEDGRIEIVDGRHPVVEAAIGRSAFVPNDIRLDMQSERMIIITGPNMAGKSTCLRQTALICIMCQAGSFVPAGRAALPPLDRVFTRVGASDNLSEGQSTFMVEMSEAAGILRHATRDSLVILDEIGRGTSTFDGLSIAWAIAEHLHTRIGCKTLFATHYHELTELALKHPGIGNQNVAVREWGDEIVFLRKLRSGGTSRSYGIEVGRLAGLPDEVVAAAREILARLEKHELGRGLHQAEPPAGTGPWQIPLFRIESGPEGAVAEQIRRLDPDAITPIEALNLLQRFRKLLE